MSTCHLQNCYLQYSTKNKFLITANSKQKPHLPVGFFNAQNKGLAMTTDEFLLLYPSFSQSATIEQVTAKLKFADLLIDKIGRFDDMRDDALVLLTAHLLTVDTMTNGGANSVQAKTSKKVGDVQFTYATGESNKEWYNLTGYGQQLLMLIDLLPNYSGAFVV